MLSNVTSIIGIHNTPCRILTIALTNEKSPSQCKDTLTHSITMNSSEEDQVVIEIIKSIPSNCSSDAVELSGTETGASPQTSPPTPCQTPAVGWTSLDVVTTFSSSALRRSVSISMSPFLQSSAPTFRCWAGYFLSSEH